MSEVGGSPGRRSWHVTEERDAAGVSLAPLREKERKGQRR